MRKVTTWMVSAPMSGAKHATRCPGAQVRQGQKGWRGGHAGAAARGTDRCRLPRTCSLWRDPNGVVRSTAGSSAWRLVCSLKAVVEGSKPSPLVVGGVGAMRDGRGDCWNACCRLQTSCLRVGAMRDGRGDCWRGLRLAGSGRRIPCLRAGAGLTANTAVDPSEVKWAKDAGW